MNAYTQPTDNRAAMELIIRIVEAYTSAGRTRPGGKPLSAADAIAEIRAAMAPACICGLSSDGKPHDCRSEGCDEACPSCC